MIQCKNICFSYPGLDIDTLHHVSFTIQEGEWVSIIGRNGSGKTTLIKMLNGLLFPHTGEVKVDGILLNHETIWQVREKVGFVFQNPENQFVGTTVFDDIAFGMENYHVPRGEMLTRAESVLKEVGMYEFRYKPPQDLSGGQKQRVALAAILVMRPRVVVLDEAMIMLDPVGKRQILELLQNLQQRYGLTIVSVTHDLSEVAYSERTLVLEKGMIIRDLPAQDILQDKVFRLEHGLGMTEMDRLAEALRDFQVPLQETYTNKEAWVADLWKLFSEKQA